jgi:hypothetical protein
MCFTTWRGQAVQGAQMPCMADFAKPARFGLISQWAAEVAALALGAAFHIWYLLLTVGVWFGGAPSITV